MFPVTKPQQCVSAASLTSNVDADVNATRLLKSPIKRTREKMINRHNIYSTDLGSVATMRVCRACLAMSVKMYQMSEHKLSFLYEQVTGIKINKEDKLPKLLCWECVARLSSAHNFIEKSLKTNLILVNKLNSSKLVSMSDIESIDRAHHKLESTLGFKVSKESDPNFYIIKESEKCNDHYNNENYTYFKECKAEPYEFNDIEVSKDEEHYEIFMEVSASAEKYPIKSEYLDVTEEQNVSDGDYREDIGDEKEAIKFLNTNSIFQSFEIGDENNIKVEDMAPDSISNVSEIIGEENPILRGALEICEDIKQKKEIQYRETPLNNLRREALPQELKVDLEDIMLNWSKKNTQDSSERFTAQSSKNIGAFHHPQIKKDILGKESNFQISETTNVPTVSTSTVDSTEHPEMYSCTYCSYKANRRNNIKSHINCRHTKKTFVTCDYCGYKSYFKNRLIIHINTMHTKKVSFNCSLCTYKAYSKRSLTRHVNAKHTKTNGLNCSFCSFKAYQRYSLEAHINAKHTKTNVYNCSYCSYTTYQKSTLSAHVNAKHTKKNVYSCSYCSFSSYQKSGLNAHVNTKHTKTNVYNCPYCNYKTYIKGNINVHVNAQHTKTKVYNCSLCSYKAYDKSTLNKHVNAMHTKTNDYNCSLCNYQSYDKRTLTRHVNAAHSETKVNNN